MKSRHTIKIAESIFQSLFLSFIILLVAINSNKNKKQDFQLIQATLIIMNKMQIFNETWSKYDKDNNGYIDNLSSKKFFDELCEKKFDLKRRRSSIESFSQTNGDGYVHKKRIIDVLEMEMQLIS